LGGTSIELASLEQAAVASVGAGLEEIILPENFRIKNIQETEQLLKENKRKRIQNNVTHESNKKNKFTTDTDKIVTNFHYQQLGQVCDASQSKKEKTSSQTELQSTNVELKYKEDTIMSKHKKDTNTDLLALKNFVARQKK
jgi:hypothetical protein